MFVRYGSLGDLPERLAVFPLTGALLLPRGRLPLNIFEPRYLAMVDDAMRGTRLIGMIQPRTPEQLSQRPQLYDVGCAGRLTSYEEADDGRLLITLTGVCRFRVFEELSVTTPYRQVQPDFAGFARDLLAEEPDNLENERAPLLACLRPYLAAQQMRADWASVERAPIAQLIDTLSAICPFGPNEKQALLEAETVTTRAHTLTTLIAMANADPPAGHEGPVQ